MKKTKIASAIPTIDHHLRSQVGTVEVTVEQGITLDQNLPHMERWESLASFGNYACLVLWEKTS